MNLLKIGSTTMRKGEVVSAIFFFAGILMILAGTKIVPAIFYMQHIVILAGLSVAASVRSIDTYSNLPAFSTSWCKEKMDVCEY